MLTCNFFEPFHLGVEVAVAVVVFTDVQDVVVLFLEGNPRPPSHLRRLLSGEPMELDVGRFDGSCDQVPLQCRILVRHCFLDPVLTVVEVLIHEGVELLEVDLPDGINIDLFGFFIFFFCFSFVGLLLCFRFFFDFLLEKIGVVCGLSQVIGDCLELCGGYPDAYGAVGREVAFVVYFKCFHCWCKGFIHDDKVDAAPLDSGVCMARVLVRVIVCGFGVHANINPPFFGDHGFKIGEASSLGIQISTNKFWSRGELFELHPDYSQDVVRSLRLFGAFDSP